MERRSLLRALSAIALTTCSLGLASAHQTGAASIAQNQDVVIEELRAAIRAAGSYPDGSVKVVATNIQLTVTIADPARIPATGPHRELQARRIVSAISRVIARRAQLKGLQAIHIDYVGRSSEGGSTRIIDAIDFRKNPQGHFRHHIT